MRRGVALLFVFGALVGASCSADDLVQPDPTATPQGSPAETDASDSSDGTASPDTAATTAGDAPIETPAPAEDGQIVIDAASPGTPVDQRLFGTNLPAWIGLDVIEQPGFVERTIASGATVLRLPGGSWSNYYDWLDCENGVADENDEDDVVECYWPWALKPTDFLDFLQATGLQGSWTVSVNGTAQEAAALVAFFNGDVDDDRSIGVDRNGVDWKTVGTWAQLRAEHGNPEPYPIRIWEVGNEVYAARPDAGPQCWEYGWEGVWTCDGVEYVDGTDEHDGYLAFREAMLAVDPEIEVGAVGIEKPDEWTDFGQEVIDTAGDQMDFYVVHHYGFLSEPSADDALAIPTEVWPVIGADLRDSFADPNEPVAVTEYNLVANQDDDGEALMAKAINTLYLADTIGQMATEGVDIANLWNLANGEAWNGTDYGMITSDGATRMPSYYALALWSRFGTTLLRVSSAFDAATELAAYGGRDDEGTISLLVVNKTGDARSASIRLDGIDSAAAYGGTADVVAADGRDAEVVTWNGSAEPGDDLTDPPPAQVTVDGDVLAYEFAPWSVTLLRLAPG
jgi:alpha-L-arabinofuranosidase